MKRDYLHELGIAESELLTRDAATFFKGRKSGYYVYIIWTCAAGFAPTPIYVGKGKGHRYAAHLCVSSENDNKLKTNTIAKAVRQGFSIKFHFPYYGLSEDAAHECEVKIIKVIGRRKLGIGPLTNLTDGGEGWSGAVGLKGKKNPNSRSVVANGISYGTVKEAGCAENISYSAIIKRIQKGWPGYFYPEQGQLTGCKGHKTGRENHKSRSVVANNKVYGSVTLAAHDIGVYPSAIFKRINTGWDGYYYENEGEKARTRPERGSVLHMISARNELCSKPKAVIAFGRRYKSMGAAAKALNISYKTVQKRCLSELDSEYSFDQ